MTVPRIGIVGADAPRQIILAAGATPVRLFGAWNGDVSREAAELLGAADVVAARVLDGVLSGLHDDLAGLVVCNDSAANLRVYYVLRLLAERGRIPYPVQLLDTPRGGGQHVNLFVARQYERLAGFVSGCTGQAVDASSLSDAAAREKPLAGALGHVRDLRIKGVLSGSAALRCYAAAAQMPPEQALAAIDAVLDEQAAAAPAPGTMLPVFMTGSSHPDATVYEALEQSGIVVAGEDHDAGDAAWLGETVDAASPGEAFSALAELHAQRPPSASRSLASERTEHLLAEVRRTGAAGVVALVRDLDDGPVWDLPSQREALAASGTWLAGVVRVPADGAATATAELIASVQLSGGISP
ncbi:2-hydroxyacyl-CoA dehydratase family protein [Arthrobacter caoxuetaonis]|uniref:2-hydroxyacyl-CoA dehydratase family protein n=1 Tax=Arthrobacter caoxuetaonis TaxID=2886935 RepID=A0A9X1MEB9_9MICC|nr:2-hydroxyacyl-CoA dehydratase family protein [Arthrobacter caoxuetaonis]MCC3298463.1 2-hydroxyacyl-CoA dehydratase family protein [Arthrobacter caoxuetaonis]USQ57525.1 2-hydroxyacyl-CoA dehydratase family protein [Arthrobacter caoxuetaonis]